jgi:hypothetical protein
MGSKTLVVNNMDLFPSIRINNVHSDDSTISEHFPEFRQLLYWNPDLTIHHEKPVYIKFKAPQNEGSFNIVIKGITGNNQPLTSSHTFLVKK